MTREHRMRYAGMFFYIILISALLLTESGKAFLIQSLQVGDNTQILLAVTSLGVALFTSEPIGFLFGSLPFILWSLKGGSRPEEGGYAAENRKLNYHLKDVVIDHYRDCDKAKNAQAPGIEEPWMKYGSDVFLTYFWHQAPHFLVDWVSRRQSAYFTNMSVAYSAWIASVLAVVIIFFSHLGWSIGSVLVLSISFLVAFLFWYVAEGARREALQMEDLWLSQGFDPKMERTLNEVSKILNIKTSS